MLSDSALVLRDTYYAVSFAQSVIETSATLLLVVIRMLKGYDGYTKIRHIFRFASHSSGR